MKRHTKKKMGGTHIRKRGLMMLFMLVLLYGCSGNGVKIHNKSSGDVAKAEEVFTNDKRLTSVVTVFHDKDIIAGVSLKTFSRFHKEKIEKELKKKLEQLYPELDITVSADRKIWMETNKLMELESTEDMEKKIDKLKSLLKEET